MGTRSSVPDQPPPLCPLTGHTLPDWSSDNEFHSALRLLLLCCADLAPGACPVHTLSSLRNVQLNNNSIQDNNTPAAPHQDNKKPRSDTDNGNGSQTRTAATNQPDWKTFCPGLRLISLYGGKVVRSLFCIYIYYMFAWGPRTDRKSCSADKGAPAQRDRRSGAAFQACK